MVADGGSVVAHLVHQAYLHFALEQGVVARPLREVAAVEEQQVRVQLALLLHHVGAAQVSSAARQGGVGQVCVERHDARVSVVGVQYDELLLLLGSGWQCCQ